MILRKEDVMVYSFGLVKHANIRYRDSVKRLSRCELSAMLHACSVHCEVNFESMGGCDFLTFECRPLTTDEITFLSGHSSVSFMSEKDGSQLRPLSVTRNDYLNEDLPEILKYKGKTSVSFTRMMLNTARSLSPFPLHETLTVLDPLCGKGTACFCALQAGMNAVGADRDSKAVHEASDYFSRYLRYYMLKHNVRSLSETAGKKSLPVTDYIFANCKEHYLSGDTRFLRLGVCDTEDTAALCRKKKVHLLLADLPYGVQHAPQFGSKPESFDSLLRRALPKWKQSVCPGGVLAISFNTLTFPTSQILEIAHSSGLVPVEESGFTGLRHEVEQAVVRDVVFMRN